MMMWAAFSATTSVFAQGTFAFRNLDFESANLLGYAPGSTVPISAALPGWSGLLGTTAANGVWYDNINIGGGAISIIDPLDRLGYVPLQGNYSALLMGTGPGFGGPTTISQTGFVPTGTRSILVDMLWFSAAPIVTLGGETVAMTPIKSFPNYTLYAGDISSFSGKTATLSFTAPVPSPTVSLGPSLLELDNITFSTMAVPEPTSGVLLLLGAVFFHCFVERRRP